MGFVSNIKFAIKATFAKTYENFYDADRLQNWSKYVRFNIQLQKRICFIVINNFAAGNCIKYIWASPIVRCLQISLIRPLL